MKKSIVKILALIFVAVMMCMLLVACDAPNADHAKAAEALEKAGYTVVYNDGVGLFGLAGAALPEGVEATIFAVKGDEEYLIVTYYDDTDALNKAWEGAEEEAKELEEKYDDIVCKKSGKMIFIGTKQAVKDAK